jgi:acyl-CoA synthetase (AMP-forming)/AMP-acid ligase II
MNLSMLLDMAADGFGSRTIVGRRTDGYTAQELRALGEGGAALIREAGANSLIYLDVNGPCFPAALFAAARAGVPFIPINYRLGYEQLEALIAKHSDAIAVADPGSLPLFEKTAMPVYTTGEWLAAATENSDEDTPAEVTDNPAVIIYTSGTTSEPKGVLLRHQNLISYVVGSVEFGAAGPDETSLISVPPYHIAAVANAITNLYAGRRCIVLEQFSGDEWLNLVRAEGVTHALVVPTMLARIMSTKGDKSVPSLRSLAYGGARMPIKVIEQALTVWPYVDFVNAYGLTETSSTITVLGPDEHRAAITNDDPAARARLGSAGTPLASVEIQIRDGSGSVVAVGTVGRIWVRGDQVSGEYAGSGSVLDADGFFDTRDQGYLDADGYLFIGGRADDTIIRGGENIAPAEIEETILSHDDVDDAVVVGVPDPEWGQHLEAAVVAKPGHIIDPEGLRDYVRARLRSSKTPDRVLVWNELPRTDTGKVVRRAVLAKIEQEPPAHRS